MNGQLKEETSASRPMDYVNNGETFNHPVNDFYIGSHKQRHHDSYIGSLRIWDLARTADEVVADMQSPENIDADYRGHVKVMIPFASSNSNSDGVRVASDSSGNGNDAQLRGGATIVNLNGEDAIVNLNMQLTEKMQRG